MPPRASTAAPPPASPGTAATIPSSASRCARTATTTPPTWCGTTRQENYGGAPSKPSNATSTRPHGTAACATQVRVAHGKAAEYQARGSVHFHALLRLDGYDPADPDRLLPPPPGITIADLDEATRWAADAISYRTPPHPAQPPGWTITWGTEIDIRRHHPARHRHRHRPGRRQLPRQVLHQGHRTRRARLRPHHRRHPRPVRQPGRHPPRTAHRRLLEDRRCTPATSACAAGRTCSASAATS